MAKNKRPAEAPRGELNQAVIRYINEQVTDAAESLRDYVDRWKSSVEPRSPRTNPGVAPPPGTPPIAESRRGMSELAMASAAGAIGGAAMAVLVVFLMRPHPSAPTKPVEATQTATATTTRATETTPAVQPATPTPADALPGEDWAHRFQYLCDREPRRLAALATNIAVNETLSGKTEKSFTAMRDQLNAGRPLAPPDGKLLRVILFQMLAHQISGLQIAVDGKAGAATAAAVPALRNDLKLESKMGTDEIANLQAETILRWAARGNL